MKWQNISIQIFITWGIRLVLFLILLYEVFSHNILLSIGSISILIISFLPAYVFQSFKFTLPRTVELLVLISLLLHAMGVSFDFYHDINYWWWDQVAHFLGTAVIALLAFEFIFALNYVKKIKMSNILLAVFVFSTSMAIGALWEIGEYFFDIIFKTSSLGDLDDTIQDLQLDALGGLCVAIFAYFYQGNLEKRQSKKGPKVGEVNIVK